MKLLSNLLIFLGLITISFGGYLIYERTNPRILAFDNVKNLSKVSDLSPKEILIPSLKIKLSIIPARIKNGNWESTKKGVSYLLDSPVPGDTGNSILYGHNWENLLGSLPKIKPGAKIEVILSNNLKKTFTVKYTQVVKPSDTYILFPSKDERITLYTCTGFLDSKRFVAVAILDDLLGKPTASLY